jgi:hypothetical protein
VEFQKKSKIIGLLGLGLKSYLSSSYNLVVVDGKFLVRAFLKVDESDLSRDI